MSFDEILDLTADVFFFFFLLIIIPTHACAAVSSTPYQHKAVNHASAQSWGRTSMVAMSHDSEQPWQQTITPTKALYYSVRNDLMVLVRPRGLLTSTSIRFASMAIRFHCCHARGTISMFGSLLFPRRTMAVH